MTGEWSDSFDPSKFEVGVVESDKPDKTGRSSKTPVHGCLLTVEDGFVSLRYGQIEGHFWMNPEATRIEIPVMGRVRTEKGWPDHGSSLVVIKGRNLKGIFVKLNEDKQVELHPSQPGGQGEAHIDAITIEPEEE